MWCSHRLQSTTNSHAEWQIQEHCLHSDHETGSFVGALIVYKYELGPKWITHINFGRLAVTFFSVTLLVTWNVIYGRDTQKMYWLRMDYAIKKTVNFSTKFISCSSLEDLDLPLNVDFHWHIFTCIWYIVWWKNFSHHIEKIMFLNLQRFSLWLKSYVFHMTSMHGINSVTPLCSFPQMINSQSVCLCLGDGSLLPFIASKLGAKKVRIL